MNIKNEAKRFFQVFKEFGGKYTITTYYFRLRKKSSEYIKRATDILKKEYRSCMAESKGLEQSPLSHRTVWSFWWQGYESLPEILKITYESHIKHIKSCGYDYVLLDKNNLANYIDIPDYIQKKVDDGIISFTHFSDYIRIALLQKYGGLWIDITLLMVNDLPSSLFDYSFYSLNLKGTIHKYNGMGQKITECKWAGFMLGTNEINNPLLSYVKLSLDEYWREHNVVIDYFLMNLLILGAYESDSQMKKYIDMIPLNNTNLYKLQDRLNDEYNPNIWKKLCQNQVFFKVTQKMSLYKHKNGKKTFFGYLSETKEQK